MKRLVPWLLAIGCGGCLHAPEIVLVDHATALEREAAGRFPKLEMELGYAGLEPRPA
jgi:hypothetical protein